MGKKICRGALIHFYDLHKYPEVLEKIKKEGYTHVNVFPTWRSKFVNQGLTLQQVEYIDPMVKKLGMGLMVNTGYMKYEEEFLKENPDCKMQLNTPNTALDSDRVAVNWACPFNPKNFNPYIEALKRIARLSSVTHLNVNDEGFLGFANGIGCYCDWCREKYKRNFNKEPPLKEDWESKDWRDWIQWRFDRWISLHEEIVEIVRDINPNIIIGIAQSFFSALSISGAPRPWQHANDNGRLAKIIDTLLAGYYHGISSYYQPRIRGVPEIGRIYKGALLDKPISFAVQGFQPGNSIELYEKDGTWMGILPQAVGCTTLTQFTYDLMQTIPAVEKAYLSTFKLDPYFEQTDPDFYCSIIHGLQSEVWDYHNEAYDGMTIIPMFELVRECGYNYISLNDNRIEDIDLSDCGPLIFSHNSCLSEKQIEKIKEYVKTGGNILAIADFALKNEQGEDYGIPPGFGLLGISSITKAKTGAYFLEENIPYPLFKEIKYPVAIKDPWEVKVKDAKVIAELIYGEKRIPALLEKSLGKGKIYYLCGDPVAHYSDPNLHGAIALPNDTVKLFRMLIREMADKNPIMWIKDFPPITPYNKIRGWDSSIKSTIELFPQKGENLWMGILASYFGEEVDVVVCVNIPSGKSPGKVYDGLKETDLDYSINSETIEIPIALGKKDAVVPIVIEWGNCRKKE